MVAVTTQTNPIKKLSRRMQKKVARARKPRQLHEQLAQKLSSNSRGLHLIMYLLLYITHCKCLIWFKFPTLVLLYIVVLNLCVELCLLWYVYSLYVSHSLFTDYLEHSTTHSMIYMLNITPFCIVHCDIWSFIFKFLVFSCIWYICSYSHWSLFSNQ